MTPLRKKKMSLEEKVKTLINEIETTLSTKQKVAIGSLLALSLVGLLVLNLSDASEITNSTVMITNMAENSGGSGSVIHSSNNFSKVLTNKHVCGLIANGGLVKTSDGNKHTVIGYKESNDHDLCLIDVASKLPGKVTLASKAPSMYEMATVSGHPALLPNVVTTGHFSGNKIINVFLGVKPCTEEDVADPDLGIICFFFQGLPQIKTYEASLVTATIMPGSSGSAIYNSSKELSAVVFAGSGEIGYAFAVPYEYVYNFLRNEQYGLPYNKPNYNMAVRSLLNQRRRQNDKIKSIEKKCLNDLDKVNNPKVQPKIKEMCEVIIRDNKWRNE